MKKLLLPGIIILTIVVLIAGVIGITKAIFTNRYDAEIAAIKAKGEPLTPKDLVGTPIPASQNAAETYKQIMQHPASYDRTIIDKVNTLHGAPIDAAMKTKLTTALAQARPLLDLTAQAVSKPKYRPDPDPITGQPDLHHFATVRSMCRLVRASSIYHAQSGDVNAAVRDVAIGFRMAAQVQDGTSLIAQLVAVAVNSIAVESAKDVARYGNLSESQARHIYDAIGSIDVAQGFQRSWLGERVQFLGYGTLSPGQIASISGGSSVGRVASVPFDAIYSRTVFKGDQAAYLRFIAEELDGIPLSYQEARSKGLLDGNRAFPKYAIISAMLAPVYAGSSFIRFKTEENLARTQAFLALQAYKARYGGYPASMQELKSKLGWKLPVDPFSEKDFIYKRQAKGFSLYSIGPDMKDDGGRAIPGDRVELGSKGDVVLRWDR